MSEKVSVGDATKALSIKVTVVGIKRFRIRLAIASQLLKLASWVSPIRVEIKNDTT